MTGRKPPGVVSLAVLRRLVGHRVRFLRLLLCLPGLVLSAGTETADEEKRKLAFDVLGEFHHALAAQQGSVVN